MIDIISVGRGINGEFFQWQLTKLLGESIAYAFGRQKWILLVYVVFFSMFISYPYVLHALGIVIQGSTVLEQVNLVISALVLVINIRIAAVEKMGDSSAKLAH